MFYSDKIDCGPSIKHFTKSLRFFYSCKKKKNLILSCVAVCEIIVELAESIIYATSIVAIASFFFSLNYL